MLKRKRSIAGIIVMIWLAFFITDFSLAKADKSPIFAVPLVVYKDGGSKEYYGLGYKIIKYMRLTAEVGVETIKTDFGTWFMEFSMPHPKQQSTR